MDASDDWFHLQSPAASDELMLNLQFSEIPQENPRVGNVSLTRVILCFLAQTEPMCLCEARINNCSFHKQREPEYKTGRHVVSCINHDCHDLALANSFFWLWKGLHTFQRREAKDKREGREHRQREARLCNVMFLNRLGGMGRGGEEYSRDRRRIF